MAESIQILPEIAKIRLEVPQVSARVEIPQVPATVDTNDVPVVLVPGKPGPPGQDGAVIGGAAIDDGAPSLERVWSSQHTHDQDAAVVESLTPDVDLVLLFDNALL